MNCLVQLSCRHEGLQFYGKGTPSQMLYCEICEVYRRSFLLLQKTAGRLLLSSSNIMNVLLALSAINQFNHSLLSGTSGSSCSQRFTVLTLKISLSSENNQSQGYHFVAEIDGMNKGFLAEVVPKRCDSCAGL